MVAIEHDIGVVWEQSVFHRSTYVEVRERTWRETKAVTMTQTSHLTTGICWLTIRARGTEQA